MKNSIDKSWDEFAKEADELFAAEKVAPVTREKFACEACRGTGKWTHPTNRFDTRECFACHGKGFFLSSPENRAKAKQARVNKKKEQRKENIQLFSKEYPEVFMYLALNVAKNRFCESLVDAIGKYGDLTENQLAAVHKGMAKEVDRAKAKEKAKKAVAVVDLSIIREKLETAKGNQVKYPKFKAGDNYVFTLAQPNSKNPDHVYVKQGDKYLGKISPDGEFFGYKLPEEHIKNVQEIAKDPLEGAKAYGLRFGNCGMCGRGLTNHRSIDAGIGPVCAEKYGLLELLY